MTASDAYDAIFGKCDPNLPTGRHSPFIDEIVGKFEALGVGFEPRQQHPAPVYRSSPIRQRRTAAHMDVIRDAIVAVLREDAPMTVRQVFYRLVSAGAIGKTEAEYKQTVCRLLAEMRRDGTIGYGMIADSTRWMRKPRTFDSVEDALRSTARLYRRNLWRDLPDYVEVWCEKDALAGVLVEATDQYDVPLMVTRGYPSLTYLHDAAEEMARQIGEPSRYTFAKDGTLVPRVGPHKDVTVYYFGDYDPSGVDIRRNVEEQLRKFIADALDLETGPGWTLWEDIVDNNFRFEPVAVLPEQIEEYRLQTRPTKTTDTRARHFAAESVELDAIPPNDLRQLVRGVIEQHLPEGALDALHVAETSERAILTRIAETMAGAA